MRILYSIALYLFTPFILLHFAIRGLKDHGYLGGWKERFALDHSGHQPGGIIIHAASVGELNAATPLVKALLEQSEKLPLTITTFTPTGSQRARTLFPVGVNHVFAPLDLPGAVQRFFEMTRPRLLIIMETEIWPNLYHFAGQKNIPILMANARMSGKSVKGYGRFRSLTRKALQNVSHAAAQSPLDAERLIACGINPEKLQVSGNLKFDLSLPPGLEQQARLWRKQWGEDRPVLIAGSTHTEDDIVVLEAFRLILESFENTLLILVPRHPERFSATAQLARDAGFKTEMYSDEPDRSPATQCLVVDSMGELLRFYACSDVAVIGGSFAAIGGHNALEAAALGLPVIVGPHTENFTEITNGLIRNGAAIRVSDANQLANQLINLLGDSEKRHAMGNAGKQMLAQGRGALRSTLEAVERLIG